MRVTLNSYQIHSSRMQEQSTCRYILDTPLEPVNDTILNQVPGTPPGSNNYTLAQRRHCVLCVSYLETSGMNIGTCRKGGVITRGLPPNLIPRGDEVILYSSHPHMLFDCMLVPAHYTVGTQHTLGSGHHCESANSLNLEK